MKSLLTAIAILILTVSCNRVTTTEESLSPIVEVIMPEAMTWGEEAIFIVRHAVFNGCGQYSRHETEMNGYDITVRFYAGYPDTFCTDAIVIREASYHFKPALRGVYTFQFYQGEFDGEEYLQYAIKVN